ncbi:hypothetical protein [Micromonospora noduli]|nr:hypothetical protein [Micromonospora noduli]
MITGLRPPPDPATTREITMTSSHWADARTILATATPATHRPLLA